jgi:hypothetical protein
MTPTRGAQLLLLLLLLPSRTACAREEGGQLILCQAGINWRLQGLPRLCTVAP